MGKKEGQSKKITGNAEAKIQEQEEIIKKLRESEEKLFAILNSARDGIVVLDKTGKISFVNKRLLEVGEYKEEEIVGKRLAVLKMFPPKSLAKITATFIKRIASKEEVSPYEVEVNTKSGEEKNVEIHGSLLKIGNKIFGDVAILRDVTYRKKIEEELKTSEEKFKVIFENAPDAYFLYDLKGNFVDGNKAAEELIGYKRKELIGKNMLELKLLPLDQIPKAAKLIAENAVGKATEPDEFTLIRKSGDQVIVEIKGMPIKLKDETVALGIARDITRHKKTEKEIERKSEELEKFNKLAVGREFRIIELKKRIQELEEKLNKNGGK